MWYPRVRIVPLDDENTSPHQRRCDVPGCAGHGEFKAPKSRYDLRDYYWFCLDHVREYNKNWDYFKGMSQGEIENHMYNTMLWDRPTWRATQAGYNEEKLRKAVYEEYRTGDDGFADFGSNDDTEAKISARNLPRPVLDALSVLDLEPPVNWEDIRKKYKSLAKKHHPDINNNSKDAEEHLKKINIAYSLLKLAYEAYTELENT